MTKYLLIALAVLAFLLAGAGALLRASYAKQGALKSEIVATKLELQGLQAASKLSAQVSVARAQVRASQARKSSVEKDDLDRLLEKNHNWSSTPVPQDVQDSLLRALNPESKANVPTPSFKPLPGDPGKPERVYDSTNQGLPAPRGAIAPLSRADTCCFHLG